MKLEKKVGSMMDLIKKLMVVRENINENTDTFNELDTHPEGSIITHAKFRNLIQVNNNNNTETFPVLDIHPEASIIIPPKDQNHIKENNSMSTELLPEIDIHSDRSIIIPEKDRFHIQTWLKSVGRKKEPKLLYRSSREGWKAQDFHFNCDRKDLIYFYNN